MLVEFWGFGEFFDTIKGDAVGGFKGARPDAAQFQDVGMTAENIAEVAGDCAYVTAFAAGEF